MAVKVLQHWPGVVKTWDKHSILFGLFVSDKENLNSNGLTHGPNVITLFSIVIYQKCMVMQSFCVIMLYYLGNYCGMAVNYHGKKFYNISAWWQT